LANKEHWTCGKFKGTSGYSIKKNYLFVRQIHFEILEIISKEIINDDVKFSVIITILVQINNFFILPIVHNVMGRERKNYVIITSQG